MITVVKYVSEGEDGPIKSTYIDAFGTRTLIAVGTTNWYTKGKRRLIPLWISRKGLFAGKVAVRIGKAPKKGETK